MERENRIKRKRNLEFLKINNEHLTTRELAKCMNVLYGTIKHYRKIAGLKNPSHKYIIPHVENLNIPDFDLGWCIGLFITDGHLATKQSVILLLANKDKDTVINFYKTLIVDFDISRIRERKTLLNGKTFYASGLCAALPIFVATVKKYTTFDKKTYDLSINREVFALASDDFKIGFLRGCIDGDGTVGLKSYHLSMISASEQFIDDIIHFFPGLKRFRPEPHVAYLVSFRKHEILDLIDKGINRDSLITMNRKSQRIADMLLRDTPQIKREKRSLSMKRAWEAYSLKKLDNIKENMKSGRQKYMNTVDGGYVSARAKTIEVHGQTFKSIERAARAFSTYPVAIKKHPSFKIIKENG